MHTLDRGDIIDMLEESATLHWPVAVELRILGKKFVDRVREVVTQDGEDWAIFESHEAIRANDIHCCSRAEPLEPTYAGKL